MSERPHHGRTHCLECGSKTVEYRHALNKGLVRGLLALYGVGGVEQLKHLQLSHNDRCNFQKLQYFSLIRKAYAPDGEHIPDTWVMNTKGRLFVESKVDVFKWVWTWRGEFVEYDDLGGKLFITDVHDEYITRADWPDESRPH